MKYDSEQITIKTIKKHAQFKDKTVLEIGCGNGTTASFLANDTKQYIGIDPDTPSYSHSISTKTNFLELHDVAERSKIYYIVQYNI